MDNEQTFELIDKLSFFAGFTQEEKQFLSTLESHIYKYQPSEFIIKEGETDYFFSYSSKGWCVLSKVIPWD